MSDAGFRIGGESADYVQVEIQQRSHPQFTDYWDGNWLNTQVIVRAGGFKGGFSASLRTDEIRRFYEAAKTLYHSLRGIALFEAMEEQLMLQLESDGKGHISVRGEARDVAGTGNVLRFELDLDQTHLASLVRSLEDTLSAFPVIGDPTA